MRYLTAAVAALLLAISPAAAKPEIGKPAPDFTAKDAAGKDVTLSALKGQKVVLEWHNPGCPFVVKHYSSDNMQNLQKGAKDAGVVWITINSSAEGKQGYMDAAALETFLRENPHYASHYITDPEGKIGRLYGASTTPHMFVIDEKGMLTYMGAIDSNASADKADIPGATNYVTETLASLQAGKPVEVASTQPYGCSVKYAN